MMVIQADLESSAARDPWDRGYLTNGDDADKFCQLGRRTGASEKEMDRVKSVSDRMVNAMKGLKKSQSRLKRSTGSTLPTKEEKNADKVAKDRDELQLLEDQSIAKNAEMNSIQEAISNQEDKNEKTIKDFNSEAKIEVSITFADNAFDAAQKDYADKLKLISDLNKALDDCNDSNADAKEAIKELRSTITQVKSQNDVMAQRQSKPPKKSFFTKLKEKHQDEIGKIGQDQEKIQKFARIYSVQ